MAAAILACGVAATAATAVLDERAQQRVADAAFEHEVDVVVAELGEVLADHADLVATLAASVAAQPVIDGDAFERTVSRVAARRPQSDVEAVLFERSIGAVPSPSDVTRTGLAVVAHAWPAGATTPRPGTDLLGDPSQRTALATSWTDDGVVASLPLTLPERVPGDRRQAVALHHRVATISDDAPVGWVSVVVDMDDLVRTVGRQSFTSFAVSAMGDDGALLDLATWQPDAAEGPTRRHATRSIDLLGRRLVVTLEDRPSAAMGLVESGRATVWLLGLGVTAVLAGLLLMVGRSERRAFALAERQTTALQNSNRELEAAVRDLELASQAKDDFLAVVSHEFRTPLTVIQGFASTVLNFRRDDLHPETTDALQRIERHARRLDGLVGDLLTTAQLANGAVVARPEVVVAGSYAVELAGQDECSELGLEVDVEPGIAVLVDRRHLETIVGNLLGNAAKYGEPPVRFSMRAAGLDVEVTVEDAGEGVPPHLHENLFERFTQADHGTTRSVKGVGLGLSIVRQLAELNSGTVRYEDAPGGGARFVVTLPSAAPALRSIRVPVREDDALAPEPSDA